jgi:hypothetical protein
LSDGGGEGEQGLESLETAHEGWSPSPFTFGAHRAIGAARITASFGVAGFMVHKIIHGIHIAFGFQRSGIHPYTPPKWSQLEPERCEALLFNQS